MLLAVMSATAQKGGSHTDSLHRVTVFPTWQKAVVQLESGKAVRVPQANIFLKRSSLIYRNSRGKTMEVPTRNVRVVEIGGRHYERIDSMLFWLVDTVGHNALYRCSRIDIAALQQQIINSRDFTNLELGTEFLNTTTLDSNDEDLEYPIMNIYYYRYEGRWVRAHDRELWRVLPKNMRQGYRVELAQPEFSWSDPRSLMSMLRRITPSLHPEEE